MQSNHPKQYMNHQSRKGLKETISLCKKPDTQTTKAEIFKLSDEADVARLEKLLNEVSGLLVHDRVGEQLKELFKIRNPKEDYTDDDLEGLLRSWKLSNDIDDYGVWVYYPWKSLLVHLVDKEEFVELRTSRNLYKITPQEQNELADKVVGVIGLSVGQSVAVTMTIERNYGTIRIADFDTLELTNLNRIRRGIDSLGLPKTTMVAREIAEIDPFVNVEIFNEGVNEKNIGEFLDGNSKMDLLIEECDSLDIKILARLEARKRAIPVLMDTSDRGMIDIERFDIEPDRKIFHGKIDINDPSDLKGLTYEEKIPFILELIGARKMSHRLKSSMIEVGQSVTTWPQLASDVTLGGAITAKIARQILLNKNVVSGRYYTETDEEWIGTKDVSNKLNGGKEIPSLEDMVKSIPALQNGHALNGQATNDLIHKAILAPSAGNVQPWKIYKKDQHYHLFLDPERIGFFGDYHYQASLLSVGGVVRNMKYYALDNGLKAEVNWFPDHSNELYVAQVSFEANTQAEAHPLSNFIETRHTNRHFFEPTTISDEFQNELKDLEKQYPGLQVHLVRDEEMIKSLAECVAKADVQRVLDKEGHKGFFAEIRWSDDMAKRTGDGIDIETVDITPAERAGFEIAKDWKAVELLSELNLGNAFGSLSKDALMTSSGAILISGKKFSQDTLVKGGELMQDAWLLATKYDYAVQPLLSTCLFYNMYNHGGEHLMSDNLKMTLNEIKPDYSKIFPLLADSDSQLFLMRLGKAKEKVKLAYRRKPDHIYKDLNDNDW